MEDRAGLRHIAAAYLKDVDDVIGRAVAVLDRRGKSVSCGAGCAWCCYLPVRATLPEGMLIAGYITGDPSTGGTAIIIERLEAWLAWNKGQDDWRVVSASAAGRFSGPGCPFLKDRLCAIYPVRPMGCRVHSSTADPALCGPHGGRPSLFSEPGTVPEILDAVKPVCLEYRRKLEEMGLQFEGMVKLLPEMVLSELKERS